MGKPGDQEQRVQIPHKWDKKVVVHKGTIYRSLEVMKKKNQQRVWRHPSVAKRGSYPSISEKNSCANPEIVVILMEDVSLIEVIRSLLYSCSLPGANNMEYAMKNILDEQIISSNRRQTGW